jgi:hypothetical protein
MKVDTNFEKLRPIGVDADLFALLQINTTDEIKRETLTLPGQAEGGGDLTETYARLRPNCSPCRRPEKSNTMCRTGTKTTLSAWICSS